jgi:hypothetical protein
LARSPELLDVLRSAPPLEPRFIHVIRNPFDNISTMAVQTRSPLRLALDRYLRLSRAVAELRSRFQQGELLEIRHEDFIANPSACVPRVLRHLGLECEPSFVASCSRLIRPSPHRSRLEHDWRPSLKDQVRRHIDSSSWLHGYEYSA